jgi:hypothetical protein
MYIHMYCLLQIKLDGWPIQAQFWLEWGWLNLPASVIPTVDDHRKTMFDAVEGPAMVTSAGPEKQNCPPQAKPGLEWATVPDAILEAMLTVFILKGISWQNFG